MAYTVTFPTRSPNFEKRAGLVAMCLAMALLPLGDAISKMLTEVATPLEVTGWRVMAQAAFFVPVAVMMRRHLRGTILSAASLLSAGLIVTVTLSLVTAFAELPIATAIAIFFVEPLLLTVLAGPFLNEVPGPRRYAAVAVGLVGALVVIRPNFVEFGPVVLLPVLGALAYALNMIVMRKATRQRSALSFQFGATLWAVVIIAAVQLTMPGAGEASTALSALPSWAIAAVIVAGALAMITFLLIAYAFSRAEASSLAPFQYLEIVGATAVGFFVFRESPDAMTLLGTAIILGSGAYVFHRERQNNVDSAAARPVER